MIESASGRQAPPAGGKPDPKQNYDFMWGRSFEDPDERIWEVVWMDVEAAKQAMGESTAA